MKDKITRIEIAAAPFESTPPVSAVCTAVVGATVGATVGVPLAKVGRGVGFELGTGVGIEDGTPVGDGEGFCVGFATGDFVFKVGRVVGGRGVGLGLGLGAAAENPRVNKRAQIFSKMSFILRCEQKERKMARGRGHSRFILVYLEISLLL